MRYQPEKNHPVCLVLWFQMKLTSGPRLQRAFNYGQETNIRCFSRRQYWCELHAPGGVVAKKRQMMTRGRGGHDTPQNWWCHLWTGPNTVFFPGILHLFWHSSKASGLILNALPNFYVIVQCTLKFFVHECKIALFPFFNTFLVPCCIFLSFVACFLNFVVCPSLKWYFLHFSYYNLAQKHLASFNFVVIPLCIIVTI